MNVFLLKRVNFIHRGQKERCMSWFSKRGNTSSSSSEPNTDKEEIIINELHLEEAVTDEREMKRETSRLPECVYSRFIKRECPPLVTKRHFCMSSLRMRYGRYGKESGLNPGICWPTRENLLDLMEDRMVFEPPLQKTVQELKDEKEQRLRERMEYEAEIDKNLENMYNKDMKVFQDKISQREGEIEFARQRKRALVKEICEFIGYDIDPKDPRFEEAVMQKEKAEKKLQKEKKRKEAYERMLAKLTKISAEATSEVDPSDVSSSNPDKESRS